MERGPARDWIEEHCPEAIGPEGIDRKVLGEKLFADEELLAEYDAVIHPQIRAEIERRIAQTCGDTAIEAALLIESGMHALADEVWLITADEETRIERMRLRNGYTESQARSRIASQMSDKAKAAFADVVIDISAVERELEAAICRAYEVRKI